MKPMCEERKARQAWKASVTGSFRRYKSQSNTVQDIYSQNTFMGFIDTQSYSVLDIAKGMNEDDIS